MAETVKHLPTMRETQVQSLGREDPLEKEMATHSSTLDWKIPLTEERGRLRSMGCKESDTTETLHFCLLKQWALNFLKADLQSEIHFITQLCQSLAFSLSNLFPVLPLLCLRDANPTGYVSEAPRLCMYFWLGPIHGQPCYDTRGWEEWKSKEDSPHLPLPVVHL